MKNPIEELCKSKFDVFLRESSPSGLVTWRDVPRSEEPPDYYVRVDNTNYAVEVTTLMEIVSVGTTSLPQQNIIDSLGGLADEIEDSARRDGYLKGAYVVRFQGPIANLSHRRRQLRRDLLAYIKRTNHFDKADVKTIYRDGNQSLSIQKIHSIYSKVMEIIGPVPAKWEGEMATQICTLLEQRLTTKHIMLEGIADPKILLLYDSYHLADTQMFLACKPKLITPLDYFHTVFICRDDLDDFILYSQNEKWNRIRNLI